MRAKKEKKKIGECPVQTITTCGGRYYFDQRAVDKVVWFMRQLRHTRSPWTGKPFELMPWQLDRVVSPLFGWKRTEDGARRFRRAYVEVPKKNGKSALSSALSLFLFMADGEYGAEVFNAANERAQAGIVFSEAKSQLRFSPLRRLVSPRPIKESTRVLLFPATSSRYSTLSSESSTKDGLNIHGLIFDELHALKDASLYHVLTQGSGAARRQPLHITITTAGSDRNSVCYAEYEAAKRVIANEREDEELLAVVYEAGERDDWKKPETWIKCNPSLGVTISMRDLEHDCKVAAKKPSIQNEFQRLRLNRWTSQVTRWLDMGEWDKCRRDYTEADLLGGMCYAGVDLSTTIDLTAVTLAFPREDGVWLWPYVFLPVERIDFATDRDNVPYDRWVREGHIIPTPGEVVDQESVVRVLSEAATKFRLQIVCFDPWRAQYVANELDRQGIQTIGIPQNYPGMSPPSVELERLIVSGRLRHPGNPCLTMAADNVEVMTGPGGVIKPMKPRQQGGTQRRIDPIVAAVMSLYHVAQGHKPEAGSVYEKRGLRFL